MIMLMPPYHGTGVRADDNVAGATGAIFNLSDTSNTVKLVGKDGTALGSTDNGQLGFGFDPRAERFNPMELTDGRWAAGPGQVVIDKLRRLDQVAYVRFASVYRQFKTLEELVGEAQAVIDARRYEDPPGQGRLFVEPATPKRSDMP